MFNLILNSSTSIDPKLYNQNWPTNCSKNGRFNQLCQNRPKTKLTQYCITTIDSKLYFTDWRANCLTNVCQKLFDKWLPKRHLPALRKNCLTYLSMTTGSEGVSFRFPQDFFSQHRLKKTERCVNKNNFIIHFGRKARQLSGMLKMVKNSKIKDEVINVFYT